MISVVMTCSYYFSIEHVDCLAMGYEGCGGNPNNFATKNECYNKCFMCTLQI